MVNYSVNKKGVKKDVKTKQAFSGAHSNTGSEWVPRFLARILCSIKTEPCRHSHFKIKTGCKIKKYCGMFSKIRGGRVDTCPVSAPSLERTFIAHRYQTNMHKKLYVNERVLVAKVL